MAHLIQPLEVDGAMYCVIFNGTRTTALVNTDIGIGAPTDLATMVEFPGNKWIMELSGTASEFEVSFGIACGSSIEFNIYSDTESTDWDAIVAVHVNGNAIEDETAVLGSGGDPDGFIALSLTDYPCGNVITVFTNIEQPDSEPVTITIEITSVT